MRESVCQHKKKTLQIFPANPVAGKVESLKETTGVLHDKLVCFHSMWWGTSMQPRWRKKYISWQQQDKGCSKAGRPKKRENLNWKQSNWAWQRKKKTWKSKTMSKKWVWWGVTEKLPCTKGVKDYKKNRWKNRLLTLHFLFTSGTWE